jgi:hypothetical protein
MINSICIIGLGNLGFRHLQSLNLIQYSLNIYTYDPNTEYIKKIHDSNIINQIHRITYLNNLAELPNSIDLVIVATNSDVRESVIIELVKYSKISFLILEKVLFQTLSSYYNVKAILEKENIKAYVNTPRRLYSFYKIIKTKLNGDELISFNLTGGAWGLASNSIHYIDLISYFNNDTGILNLSSNFINRVFESKRIGFMEYYGSIYGNMNGTIFKIICDEKPSPSILTLITKKNIYKIIEANNSLITIGDNNISEINSIKVPYQSELTFTYIENINSNGEPGLVSYSISMNHHLLLIKSFLDHQKLLLGKEDNICKIT